MTDHERELAEAHRRGYREGYEEGRESTSGAADLKVEWLERRVKELEQKLDDATRVHEVDGGQAVEVDGYAYLWRGAEPLEVGDHVLLPENYVSRVKNGPGPTRGVVTRLGITYRGELATIIGRAPRDHG
ncbi:hypothetical protein [Actinomadura rugatobispora]|uniref:DUF1707 domain-containing protein n=1 Tax=Actinomadura rugatobispora TaxID=1994 RepID=A0ABW1ADJ5_9ACTN